MLIIKENDNTQKIFSFFDQFDYYDDKDNRVKEKIQNEK